MHTGSQLKLKYKASCNSLCNNVVLLMGYRRINLLDDYVSIDLKLLHGTDRHTLTVNWLEIFYRVERPTEARLLTFIISQDPSLVLASLQEFATSSDLGALGLDPNPK